MAFNLLVGIAYWFTYFIYKYYESQQNTRLSYIFLNFGVRRNLIFDTS